MDKSILYNMSPYRIVFQNATLLHRAAVAAVYFIFCFYEMKTNKRPKKGTKKKKKMLEFIIIFSSLILTSIVAKPTGIRSHVPVRLHAKRRHCNIFVFFSSTRRVEEEEENKR